MYVRGTDPPPGLRLRGETDHRLVMSAAVGALGASSPSSIEDASAVEKSFPAFWESLRTIGAEVEAA